MIKNLPELFASLFSSGELERFAQWEYGDSLFHSLPRGASLMDLSWALADSLDKRGKVNDELWQKLRVARPGRVQDINGVRDAYRTEKPPPTGTPPADESGQAAGPRLVLLLTANLEHGTDFTDRETRRIRVELEGAEFRDRLVLDQRTDTTISDIAKRLRRDKPTVIHFTGEGRPGGRLVLRDADGEAQEMEPGGLVRILSRSKVLRLVVLNGSHTNEIAQQLVPAVDFAIGHEGPLLANAALTFSPPFYSALADGASVREAFETAGDIAAAMPGDSGGDYRLFQAESPTKDGIV